MLMRNLLLLFLILVLAGCAAQRRQEYLATQKAKYKEGVSKIEPRSSPVASCGRVVIPNKEAIAQRSNLGRYTGSTLVYFATERSNTLLVVPDLIKQRNLFSRLEVAETSMPDHPMSAHDCITIYFYMSRDKTASSWYYLSEKTPRTPLHTDHGESGFEKRQRYFLDSIEALAASEKLTTGVVKRTDDRPVDADSSPAPVRTPITPTTATPAKHPEPAGPEVASRTLDTAAVRGVSRAPLVGDTWTYRLVDERQERTLATVTHVVAAVTKEFVEESIAVKELKRWRSQEETPLGIEFTELRLGEGLSVQQFSPFLGTQMELAVDGTLDNIPGLHSITSFDKWKTTARVVAHEKISLPAGEFDTFRVEIEAERGGTSSDQGPNLTVRRIAMTEWFTQKTKRVLKITRKTYNNRGDKLDDDRYELLSYKQN